MNIGLKRHRLLLLGFTLPVFVNSKGTFQAHRLAKIPEARHGWGSEGVSDTGGTDVPRQLPPILCILR